MIRFSRVSLFIAASLMLGGCAMIAGGDAKAPRIQDAGTCFALVRPQEDGTFALLTGIGDGTVPPKAIQKTGLSAEQVDAALAHEQDIMKIDPECLSSVSEPRPPAR